MLKKKMDFDRSRDSVEILREMQEHHESYRSPSFKYNDLPSNDFENIPQEVCRGE